MFNRLQKQTAFRASTSGTRANQRVERNSGFGGVDYRNCGQSIRLGDVKPSW